MKKLILFTIILSSIPSFALSASGDRYAEDRMDDAQAEMVKQRLNQIQREEAPSSTSIGGSRSGQLDFEKRQDIEQMRQEQEEQQQEQDEQERYDLDKQRQLYEYDDQYRRGL